MIIAQKRQILIDRHDETFDIIERIIERIDHMSFRSKQDDVLDALSFLVYLDDISGKFIPWIILIAYDELRPFYHHFDHLVVERGIIKISSEKKENKHGADDIVIEYGDQEYARKNNSKHQISRFASLEFLSIVDENTHQIMINE